MGSGLTPIESLYQILYHSGPFVEIVRFGPWLEIEVAESCLDRTI